jgi:IS5 family transposase
VRARFRQNGQGSFFGDMVYEKTVPQTHFWRQLVELIDWESLTLPLSKYYKGEAEYGPIPYHPSTLFRMLLVAYLYGLSERQVESYVMDSLAARYFLGLAADEAVPDHSTLSVFRQRIIDHPRGGVKVFEELFGRVVQIAREKGIEFGRIQVVDSTHSIADVNVKGDGERHRGGKARRDRDASWGSKGRRWAKMVDGKMGLVNKVFYGYKAHISLNAESGLITSVVASTGRVSDGQQFERLVNRDEALGVKAEVYAGDKGYDDGENHELLRRKGKKSALILNRYRTEKKDSNKQVWIELESDPDYEAGKRERYRVEQKFGEGKRKHGWGRCRYVGLKGYSVQCLLTGMVLNLKRMVKLLCEVAFSQPARRLARA